MWICVICIMELPLYLGQFTITGHHCPGLLKEYVIRNNEVGEYLKIWRKVIFQGAIYFIVELTF